RSPPASFADPASAVPPSGNFERPRPRASRAAPGVPAASGRRLRSCTVRSGGAPGCRSFLRICEGYPYYNKDERKAKLTLARGWGLEAVRNDLGTGGQARQAHQQGRALFWEEGPLLIVGALMGAARLKQLKDSPTSRSTIEDAIRVAVSMARTLAAVCTL